MQAIHAEDLFRHAEDLFRLAEDRSLTVRVEPRTGEFVLPGALLGSVWPATAADAAVQGAIRDALVVGPERTLRSDVELGVRQLADIAITALSPGINDPTTAIICIDRLGEVLVRLGHRARPNEVRMGDERVAAIVPAGRRAPLARQARLVLAEARDRISIQDDLELVERAGAWATGP